jgi:hypothetical protein
LPPKPVNTLPAFFGLIWTVTGVLSIVPDAFIVNVISPVCPLAKLPV